MSDLYGEAIQRFKKLFAQAAQVGLNEPTAMTLATADAAGQPSARTVLLKSVSTDGFTFFTNLESRKGRQLLENPRAALSFYWDPLKQQVHVEGPVEPISTAEADAYWASRPRKSQIGAWASQQSRPLASRIELVTRVTKMTAKYLGRAIPRPPYWNGFRLHPQRIEFWTSRAFRLHERVLYQCDARGHWTKGLLYP